MTNLGDLKARAVYRRSSRETYLKLNNEFHVRVKLVQINERQGNWVGDGSAEKLNPSEEVAVIQQATET